jgi:hypothetical protein
MTDSLVRFPITFGMMRECEQWRERLSRVMAERGTSAEGTLTQAEYLHELRCCLRMPAS